MIKFPYGNSDFYKISHNGYFYIDRTGHIPLLENAGDSLLFLRPRRFGKSLLLSMLENYYDIAKADMFETLFGHLKIGQAPTPLHNQYLILKWDFSVVDPQGEIQGIKEALHNHVNNSLQDFSNKYKRVLPYPIKINTNNAIASLESTLSAVNGSDYKLYLLIDS